MLELQVVKISWNEVGYEKTNNKTLYWEVLFNLHFCVYQLYNLFSVVDIVVCVTVLVTLFVKSLNISIFIFN